MPTKTYQIKPGYPVLSLISMAEQIGKLTGSVVVCTPVIQIEAAGPVLQALDALLPAMKSAGKKRKAAKFVAQSEASDEGSVEDA